MSVPVITSNADLEKAVRELLEYNWSDEARNFEEHQDETDCHIFVTMVALANWFDGTETSPEECIRSGNACLCGAPIEPNATNCGECAAS